MSWYKDEILEERTCLNKHEIEDYVQKSLAQDKRFAVENHLLSCQLCSDAVDGYMNHPRELTEYSSKFSNYRNWIYLAAASVLLLLGATAFFNYQATNLTNHLFASYYEKPSWDVQSRGSDQATSYSESIQLYRDGHYESAISAFGALLEQNKENNQLRIYKGISHLESNQLSLAKEEFTIVRVNSQVFFEEATWYLAMLYIKMDQKQEAISYLDEIIDSGDNFFSPKAIEIKKRLQK